MAELADAQRSGRCWVFPSTGSTPASGIILNNIFYLNHENALKWAFLFFINFNLKIIREHRHTIDTR